MANARGSCNDREETERRELEEEARCNYSILFIFLPSGWRTKRALLPFLFLSSNRLFRSQRRATPLPSLGLRNERKKKKKEGNTYQFADSMSVMSDTERYRPQYPPPVGAGVLPRPYFDHEDFLEQETRHKFDQLARLHELYQSKLALANVSNSVTYQRENSSNANVRETPCKLLQSFIVALFFHFRFSSTPFLQYSKGNSAT